MLHVHGTHAVKIVLSLFFSESNYMYFYLLFLRLWDRACSLVKILPTAEDGYVFAVLGPVFSDLVWRG